MDLGINFEVIDEESIKYDMELLNEDTLRLCREIESNTQFLEKDSEERKLKEWRTNRDHWHQKIHLIFPFQSRNKSHFSFIYNSKSILLPTQSFSSTSVFFLLSFPSLSLPSLPINAKRDLNVAALPQNRLELYIFCLSFMKMLFILCCLSFSPRRFLRRRSTYIVLVVERASDRTKRRTRRGKFICRSWMR